MRETIDFAVHFVIWQEGAKVAPDSGRFRLHCHVALTYFRFNKHIVRKSGSR